MAQRILVVDDEAHILQVMSLKLRKVGYEVVTATDGEEAYEIATREQFDLIITDYQMPYMTGLELCRALSNKPETAGIPVLILTARGYSLDEKDLTISSIKDVLSKPFSPRAIVQQVHEILENKSSGTAEKQSENAHPSSARDSSAHNAAGAKTEAA